MKKLLLAIPLIFNVSCQADGPKEMPAELSLRKASLMQVAEQDKNRGKHNQAAELQTALMDLDAYKPETFITLSKTLKKQGYTDSAVDFIQGAESLHPNNEQIKLEVAKALVEDEQPDEALAKLEQVRNLKNRDYYNTLGVAYDMKGDHEAAQEALEEGLEQNGEDELLLNNLALSYILSGDYESGIDILKDLVKVPNAKPKYRQNLALAYGLSAKPEQAKKLLVKDLSKKEAEENLKFYKELREQQ